MNLGADFCLFVEQTDIGRSGRLAGADPTLGEQLLGREDASAYGFDLLHKSWVELAAALTLLAAATAVRHAVSEPG